MAKEKSMHSHAEITRKINKEIRHAEEKYPSWPVNRYAAFAIVSREFEYLEKAVTDEKWFPTLGTRVVGDPKEVEQSGIRVAAALRRFLSNLRNTMEGSSRKKARCGICLVVLTKSGKCPLCRELF